MRLSRILPIAAALGLGAWAIRKFLRVPTGRARTEEPPFDDDAEILIIEEEIIPLH